MSSFGSRVDQPSAHGLLFRLLRQENVNDIAAARERSLGAAPVAEDAAQAFLSRADLSWRPRQAPGRPGRP